MAEFFAFEPVWLPLRLANGVAGRIISPPGLNNATSPAEEADVRATITALVVGLAGGTAAAQTPPKPAPPLAPAPPSSPALPAAVTPQPAQSSGADTVRWESRCTAESRGGQQDCLLQQVVPIATTQLFMTVVIRSGTDRPDPVISIDVPLGVLLQPGLLLRLDDGKTQVLPFLFCIDRGCHAGADLNPDMVKALNQASHLTVALQTLDKRSFAVPITTGGFSAAFDKIK
jgi:invasion protein IalB